MSGVGQEGLEGSETQEGPGAARGVIRAEREMQEDLTCKVGEYGLAGEDGGDEKVRRRSAEAGGDQGRAA